MSIYPILAPGTISPVLTPALSFVLGSGIHLQIQNRLPWQTMLFIVRCCKITHRCKPVSSAVRGSDFLLVTRTIFVGAVYRDARCSQAYVDPDTGVTSRCCWAIGHLRVFLVRRTRVARILVSTPRMVGKLLIMGDSAVRLLVTLRARSAW
jgi:hypothetical protein